MLSEAKVSKEKRIFLLPG